MMKETVLILGMSGVIGRAILNQMKNDKQYEIYGTYHDNPIDLQVDKCFKLQIEDINALNHILKDIQPRIVISCLRGDFHSQLILHKKIAEYLKDNHGKMYFCSTANVFDNDGNKPHYELDMPNAESDYGKFKIKCEKDLRDILEDNSSIIRLPQIWGKGSPRMKELTYKLENNKEIEMYTNMLLTFNTDEFVAQQIHYVIKNDLKGIFHLATSDMVTQYEFYKELINRMGYRNAIIKEITLPVDKYYFSILANRKDLPKIFSITSREVLNYLLDKY